MHIFTHLRTVAQNGLVPRDKIEGLPNANTTSGIQEVFRIVFIAGGVIAVIVIIIAGIQFMLSGGDPGKAAAARNTIIYALIGLVVCILATSIVTFVIGEAG